jgi:hypothetical protein
VPHEFVVDATHAETERYIHAGTTEKVITGQAAREASRTHDRFAATDCGLDETLYFFNAGVVEGCGIGAGFEDCGNARQFAPEQIRDGGCKSEYSQEEHAIGDGPNFQACR